MRPIQPDRVTPKPSTNRGKLALLRIACLVATCIIMPMDHEDCSRKGPQKRCVWMP